MHLGFTGEYNSVNPYVEYQHGNLRAGAYYNSEENISAYGGVNLNLLNNFSVDTGVATGYFENTLTPYAKFNYHYNENITIFAMPGAETQQDNTTQYGIVSGLTFNF